MPLLTMTGVGKSFGQVAALSDVDFALEAGEVHALVGENGAGKSTLMKILAGVQPPDAGRMVLAGDPVRFASVNEAQSHGVIMVYQELALVPTLSVAENLFLGRLPKLVAHRELHRRASTLLAQVELDLDPAREVSRIGIGEKQLVEIARALAREGRILVLDEPTAALSSSESERLFGIIAKVKASGVALVYISHRLEEVFRIADRVTVLRDGRLVGRRVVADTTPDEIVQLMVGKSVRRYERTPRATERTLGTFEASGPGLDPVTIRLQAGEIVGLAGVIGSGRERILPTLFGLEGTASWTGAGPGGGGGGALRSPREAIRAGIVLVPSDRKTQGLVMDLSVQENVSLATLPRLQRLGFMDGPRERAQTMHWIDRLSLRPPRPHKPVRELSGGNQQKVVVAKALATEPAVLLLDEPTRGVDVGARAELYDVIDGLSKGGLGLLLSSSDTEELLGLSDRILVFRAGRVRAELAVLIVNPTDSAAVVPAVMAANAAGIPVIAVDRGVDGGMLAYFIASDNVAGGSSAGEFICEQLEGMGPVVELEGIPGVSATRERGQGFNDFIRQNCPGITVVARQTANFNRAEGLSVMENILTAQPDIAAVFAHNDEMALGALQAIEASGRDILVVGFDATDDAVAAVEACRMGATVAQLPAQLGAQAVEAAHGIITGGAPAATENIAVGLELVINPACP